MSIDTPGRGPVITVNPRELRERAADTAVAMARVIADNPGQTAVMIAGTVVITRAAANLVRPRTPFQALCLCVMLQLGIPKLVQTAGERGWMQWYARDEDGNKIPVFGVNECPNDTRSRNSGGKDSVTGTDTMSRSSVPPR